MNVRVDGVGRFVEDGCDDARGAVGKLGLLVVEDTVNDTAVVNALGIGPDRVCESGQAFVELSAEDLTDVGADRDGRLVLLVVLEERAAAHLAQRGPLRGLVRIGHQGDSWGTAGEKDMNMILLSLVDRSQTKQSNKKPLQEKK